MEFPEIINTLQTYQAMQDMGTAKSFDHSFHAANSVFNRHVSTIRVHIYTYHEFRLVVFQDLGKGTSVTNASEQLATEIARLENLDPEKTIWLECYPYYGGDYDIDRITYNHDPRTNTYSDPNWAPIKNKLIIEFLQKNIKA